MRRAVAIFMLTASFALAGFAAGLASQERVRIVRPAPRPVVIWHHGQPV